MSDRAGATADAAKAVAQQAVMICEMRAEGQRRCAAYDAKRQTDQPANLPGSHRAFWNFWTF